MKNKDLIELVDKKKAREAAKEAQRQQQADAQLKQMLQDRLGKIAMEYQDLEKEAVKLRGYLENDKARFVELYTVVFLNALKRGLELAAAKKDALDAITVLQELREELYTSAPENKDIRAKINTIQDRQVELQNKANGISAEMAEIDKKWSPVLEKEEKEFLDDGVDALPPEPTTAA